MEIDDMIEERNLKVDRILTIFLKLQSGGIVNKKELKDEFNVNEKTIQRDIEHIRLYLSENRENFGEKDIVYSRTKNGYFFDNRGEILDNSDILAIVKILLESRAFCKEEMKHLITSILGQVDNEQRRKVKDNILNEYFNYVPLNHGELLLSRIWDLSEYIRNREVVQVFYKKTDGSEVKRFIKPVAIIFSEYYFYLIAFLKDYSSPTVFRIDRIKEYKKIGQKFCVSNSERFEDGEFRKRVQFMYPGKLMKITFQYIGDTIDAILDRLPTARVIKSVEGRFILEAEIYGKGIIMWILSQGRKIKVIEPLQLVEEIKIEIESMRKIYE